MFHWLLVHEAIAVGSRNLSLFMGMSYDSTNIMGLGYETIGMFLTCEEF